MDALTLAACKRDLNRAWDAVTLRKYDQAVSLVREQLLLPHGDELLPDAEALRQYFSLAENMGEPGSADIRKMLDALSRSLNQLSPDPSTGPKVSKTVFCLACLPWLVLAATTVVYLYQGMILPSLSARLIYFQDMGDSNELNDIRFTIPNDGLWHNISIDLPGQSVVRVHIAPAMRGAYFEHIQFRNTYLHSRTTGLVNEVPNWFEENGEVTWKEGTYELRSVEDAPRLLGELTYTEKADRFTFDVRAKAAKISLWDWVWRWPA